MDVLWDNQAAHSDYKYKGRQIMKALPLFYYPSTWLWVDDDKTALNTMKLVFGEKNAILPFQSARQCLDYLSTYKSPLSQHSFLKSITDHENYGILQKTPIDFDVTALSNLVEDSKRHEEITVMVIDYHMPEMDGFALAEAAQNIPAKKILLTGKAQESEAIIGFNRNLIQRFVQKAEEKMTAKLTSYLEELTVQYFEKLTFPLLSYLEAEAVLPQSDPVFIKFFESYQKENNIKEYYLIDKQGSLLCVDSQNNRFCLAIQSSPGIDNWLSLYTDETSPDVNLTPIKERKKIPFFGAGKEAWQVETDKWPQHFYECSILEGRQKYFWATIK